MNTSERESALRRLAIAEEVTARARARAARQRLIVAKLEAAGDDAVEARALLAAFEATQANQERCLAQLLNDLTQRGWKHAGP